MIDSKWPEGRGTTPESTPARRLLVAFLLSAVAAASSAETLLVVRKSDHALEFVDPGSGLTLASVATGYTPHEVSVSPDGTMALVTNYGTREQPGASLSLVDLANAREAKRIELGTHTRPHGVDWYAADRAAVTTEGSRHLLIVDPGAGRVVRSIETGQDGSHMVAVDAAGSRAFVTNMASGSTSAFELATGRKLGEVATGRGSEAIAIAPGGREVWVGSRDEGKVRVLDADSLSINETIDVPGAPIRIIAGADGKHMLVTSAASSELTSIDATSKAVVGRHAIETPIPASAGARAGLPVGAGSVVPVGIAASGDGRAIYVAATRADAVLVLDPATMKIVRRIDVAGEPDGLGLTQLQPKATCHACEPPR